MSYNVGPKYFVDLLYRTIKKVEGWSSVTVRLYTDCRSHIMHAIFLLMKRR